MPLDPYNVTPNASINRVKLMSAPGLPEAWQGKTAYQVMGRESLVRRIGEAIPELANLADPVRTFSEVYLAQQHPAAVAIADEMGRALSCLLLILKHGETANRVARPEWDNSYWAQWGSIQHVILGGGIMAGLLGKYMLAKATEMLDGLLSLTIADYPAALPLIGAARMVNETNEAAWVFDFGGTNIKRANAVYTNGELAKLEQLPTIFIPVFNEAHDLFDFMVQAVVNSASKSDDHDKSLSIRASIANYVQECRLAPDTSYGRLGALGEDICQLLSEAVSQKLARRVNLIVIHDGTAAAKVYAGTANTAVITIGTALGFGFPPPDQSLRSIRHDFSIRFVEG